MLTRDAGLISLVDSFDGDEFVGSEVVVSRGPHPAADSDFTQFCGTVVAALAWRPRRAAPRR